MNHTDFGLFLIMFFGVVYFMILGSMMSAINEKLDKILVWINEEASDDAR